MKKSTLLFIAIILTSFYGVKVFAQGVAINTDGTAPSTMLHIKTGDGTNTVFNILRIDRLNTTAAGADGIGSNIGFFLEGTGAGSMVQAASIDVVFDRAAAPVEGSMTFNVNTTGTLKEVMRVDGSLGRVGIGSNDPGALLDVVSGTTTGTGAKVDVNALTSGVGFAVNSLNAPSTGNAFLVSSNSTGAQVAGIARFNFTGNHANAGFLVQDVTTAGVAISVNANAVTTGKALDIYTDALTSGVGLSMNSNSAALIGSMQNISLTGNNAANTGNLLTLNSSGALNVAKALQVSIGSTGNLSTGGVMFNFSGDHTGKGFQIDDVTTAGTVAAINANNVLGGKAVAVLTNALTSGTGLDIASNSAALTGSLQSISLSGNNVNNTGNLLNINSSGATSIARAINVSMTSTGNLGTGGVIFNFNGAHTGSGFGIIDVTTGGDVAKISANNLLGGNAMTIESSTVGLTGTLQTIRLTGNNANNTNASSLLNISSQGALSVSKALLVGMASTGNLAAGGVAFDFTGDHTGTGFLISDVTTTGTVATINANNVLGGKAVTVNTNALTTGTALSVSSSSASLTSGTLLDISSASTGSTGSLVNIKASGNNAGNTGTLLRVSNSEAAGALSAQTLAMVTNKGSGLGFRVNDDGTDADASPFIVDATGNVAVGILNPQVKLAVSGGIAAGLNDVLRISGGAAAGASGVSLSFGNLYGDVTNATYPTWTTGSIGCMYNGATSWGGDIVFNNNSGGTMTSMSESMRILYNGNVGIGSAIPGATLDIVSAVTTGIGGRLTLTALTTGTGLSVSSTNAPSTGNAFLVSSNSTGLEVAGIARFNFTGAHTGDGLQITDATATGKAVQVGVDALTSGIGLGVASAATGLTTGSLVDISLSGSNANNDGNLLRIAHTGVLSEATALMITNLGGTGSTSFRVNDETGDADATPFIINSTGNVGIGTTTPNVAALGSDKILTISSTNDNAGDIQASLELVGAASAVNGVGNIIFIGHTALNNPVNMGRIGVVEGTAPGASSMRFLTNNGALTEQMRIDENGNVGIGSTDPTFKLDIINTGTTAGGVRLTTNSLTSGLGLNVRSSSAALTGDLANLTLSGSNAGNTNAGALLNLVSSGVLSTTKALEVTVASTGALTAGGVLFDFTGAHTSAAFQINDVTQTGAVMNLTASALTTGVGLQVTSSNAAATGKALYVTSNSGGLCSNGIVNFDFTAAHTGNGIDINDATVSGDVFDISASAVTTGNVFNISAGTLTSGEAFKILSLNAITTGHAMQITAAPAAFTGNGLVEISMTGANAANTGSSLRVSMGLTNTGVPLYVENQGAGISFQVDDASGDASPFVVSASGAVGIRNSAPAQALDVVGNGTFTGTVTASCGTLVCSDIRYKKNIKTLDNSLANILKLEGVSYDWKKEEFPEKEFTDKKQIGFIAQELEKIYPELVHTDEKGYKTVDYTRLTPILVNAIKEQQQMIDELRAENGTLKTDNKTLNNKVENNTKEIDEIKMMLNLSAEK